MITPVRLPLVRRRCHTCASSRFRASGKFRVNANHKLIDAWLLALCTACGETIKLTVLERRKVRSIRPELLDLLHDNDLGLTAELLQDPIVQRRNRVALDWDGAWRLDTNGLETDGLETDGLETDGLETDGLDADAPDINGSDHLDHDVIDVAVHFAARIPVRPVRLIGDGCGLSRAEVDRLIVDGKIVSAVRLSGVLSSNFTFTLKR